MSAVRHGVQPEQLVLGNGSEDIIQMLCQAFTGHGDVVKFPKYRRLPHYWLRATNYFRRGWYLLRKGYLWPKCGRDLTKGGPR